MQDIADEHHLARARQLKRLYSSYQQNRDLISVGAYQKGSDPRIDEAIAMNPGIMAFLQQDMNLGVNVGESLRELDELLGKAHGS